MIATFDSTAFWYKYLAEEGSMPAHDEIDSVLVNSLARSFHHEILNLPGGGLGGGCDGDW